MEKILYVNCKIKISLYLLGLAIDGVDEGLVLAGVLLPHLVQSRLHLVSELRPDLDDPLLDTRGLARIHHE